VVVAESEAGEGAAEETPVSDESTGAGASMGEAPTSAVEAETGAPDESTESVVAAS